MTRLYIEVDRDAHDDDRFVVCEEKNHELGACDNCGRDLAGGTILGEFYSRTELMVYLTAKIKSLTR